ncbi:MAG: hypothetical protein CMF96_01225 [Candidatus Marinimicrobia bacterium]|nr:hypothetical protein [Candidatus Neomarinimicrobiota bacterium]|tara:strand:+ start:2755 stop:4158 length:1404 start_codon:yes stop_codon:yes gene_type:complete
MRILFIPILIFIGCSYVLENDTLQIEDVNGDGKDDRDIEFLQVLIENSQGFNNAPPDTLNVLELGEQIWVEGRLRSLKHTGGLFYLYGQIPEEIENVEYLNKLHLEDNRFTSIHEGIGKLQNLSEIILNDNRFSGIVPEELWQNKSNLKNLSIFNNYFNQLPESICESYDSMENFIFSHNNICEMPSCIKDAGIQSCDCFDYITMDICINPGDDLSCENNIGQIIDNCPLKQFWGESLFEELSDLNSSYCVDWVGTCNDSINIGTESINFDLNLDQGCFDCNGNPCDETLSWIGDGICDEIETFTDMDSNGLWDDGEPFIDLNGNGIWDFSTNNSFSCEEFNCDMEDCGFYLESENSCYCQRDCSGKCINQDDCAGYYYYYDCCIDDGTCQDVISDGEIIDWVGDGWCDDGTWGYAFNCQESGGFEFNCDDGDCGFWNPETGQCEPAPGQIIKYYDDYKINKYIEKD